MSLRPLDASAHSQPRLERLIGALQDALLEVDVWRRHARHAEEWVALRRIATSIAEAKEELEAEVRASRSEDPLQGTLLR